MSHKVFISYASPDKAIADAVCVALETHGIKCWYAPRDVPYGQDFDEAIVDAICASRLMILILSSHSNKSAHVKREIQNACMDDARVPILPFRVEDLPLNKALRYYIGAVHWLDAVTPPLESHLNNLVQHVEARLPRTAQLPVVTEPGAVEPDARSRDEALEPKGQDAVELQPRTIAQTPEIERKQWAAEEIESSPAVQPVAATMTNRIGIEFMLIPPGVFMMGSEKGYANENPAHRVTISKGFYMGKYQVTQEQWQAVMGNNPSHFKGKNLPVENVTWDDAIAFIARLNAQHDGYTYRLPSEAEWEYAARAGTTGEYAGDLDAIAWYWKNPGGTSHPVGCKQPNAFGLFDMYGNVWEWCQDWYHNSYMGAPADGSAWLSGGEQKYRVMRGGSWKHDASYCRSAYRLRNSWISRHFLNVGLRVVAVAQ